MVVVVVVVAGCFSASWLLSCRFLTAVFLAPYGSKDSNTGALGPNLGPQALIFGSFDP